MFLVGMLAVSCIFAVTASVNVAKANPIASTLPVTNVEISLAQKVSEFFSTVVRLNMSEHTLVDTSPIYTEGMLPDFRVNYTTLESTYGGLVNVSKPSYRLQIAEDNLDVKCMFYSWQLAFLRIESQDDYVFPDTEESSIVRQAQTMLEGYQTYVREMYADNNSYVESILNILKSTDSSSPKNSTLGDVSLQILIDGDETRVRWIYCPNGVIIGGKYLELVFVNGSFNSFADTWRHYNCIEISKISPNEAFSIALEAAQKVEFTIVWGNGSIITYTVPDLSNARYGMDLYVSKQSVSWHIVFYFDNRISHVAGVEVGVWGNNGEIINCHEYLVRDYPFPDLLPAETSPQVSILSPANASYAAIGNSYTLVPLTFVTNASLSWVGYSLDGGVNVTGVNGTSIELPVNSESLTLYANDTSGNWALPVTVYFTVAWNGGTPPPPFPWLPVAAAGVIVAVVVAASAVVYLKKRKREDVKP
jgi:hypothetical protein